MGRKLSFNLIRIVGILCRIGISLLKAVQTTTELILNPDRGGWGNKWLMRTKHALDLGGEKRGLITDTKSVNLIQLFFIVISFLPPF